MRTMPTVTASSNQKLWRSRVAKRRPAPSVTRAASAMSVRSRMGGESVGRRGSDAGFERAGEHAQEEVAELGPDEVAVLEPIEDRTVHEPQPAASGCARRGRRLVAEAQPVEDPRRGAVAN